MSADLVTWVLHQLVIDTNAIETEIETGAPLFRPAAELIAEVEAKRAIIDLHSPAGITSDPPYKWACSVCHRRDGWWAGEYPCTTVRLLVAPFASRPGFDPSWLD